MSSISIIGAGNMARAIGALALDGGNTVELIGRDEVKAKALARELGAKVTTRAFGDVPAGDIVILAVLHASAASVVEQYGDALSGKVIVDITNRFAPDATGLVNPNGPSVAEQIAQAAPADARVVKAFNTVFGHILATVPGQGRPLDIFVAGDDGQAKASVAALIESMGLRPMDVGSLAMATSLEHAGLLVVGLAQHGVKHFQFALGVDIRN